jgi:hypothetical protein
MRRPRLRCLPRLSGRAPQVLVAQKVTTGVYKGVTTSELDELAAETAASMTANHPDYAVVRRPRACAERASTLASGARGLSGVRRRARSWPRAWPCPTCTRTR